MSKSLSKADLRQFNLALWIEQILKAAEKEGLSPETMAQLRYNALQTIIGAERDKIRLEALMRECGIR